MATAGIFRLITNDGKQDRLIMASELLKFRLKRIMKARLAAGIDPTPTLVDVEKTHILFMNAHFKPFAATGYEYNKVRPSTGLVTLGSTVQFQIPQFGDFFSDMAFHVILSDPTPTGGVTPTYRWCQYPGERLCARTSFTVNGNPLDEYYSYDYTFYRQLELQNEKIIGYNRCMGQENPEDAEVYQSSVSDPTNSRLKCTYYNGFQTPKEVHGQLEMFIPLLFWFNKDPRMAIPSVAIPFGMRFIEIQLAQQTDLIGQEVRGNAEAGTLGEVNIAKCELYINNIFVNPEIHDIYIRRIGFNLIRVHRHQVVRLSTPDNSVLMNNFKWPIEGFAVGFKPVNNANIEHNDYSGEDQQVNYLDHWHYFSRVRRNDVTGNPFTTFVDIQEPVISNMTVHIHNIELYSQFPGGFYNSYLPLVNGDRLRTPSDVGVYYVGFNLYPKIYQPSGHVNASRAREFYIRYQDATNTISLSNPVDLITSATAINFLLVSDGSCVLRYST